jgi:hypothetical protein
MGRRSVVAGALVALVAFLGAAGCRGGSSSTSSSTTAVPPSGGAATTMPVLATGAAATTAAPAAGTTAAPGAATSAPAASAASPGANATAPATTAGNGAASAAGTPAAASADAAKLCAGVQSAVPLHFVVAVANLTDADSVGPTEVALAPLLAQPLADIVASAPPQIAAPFRVWAERNAKALAAFRSTGATDAQIAAYVRSFQADLADVADNGGGGTPLPLDKAAKAGIDTTKLTSAAQGFVAANGSFATFQSTLDQQLTFSGAVQDQLEQQLPCASDLSGFITSD